MLTITQLQEITKDNARLPVNYVERQVYFNKLKQYLNTDLIKVIVGMRRVGKTFLLKLLYNYLIKHQNIPGNNVLFLNFEDPRLAHYLNVVDLQAIYNNFLGATDPKQEIFLFLDEIQNVQAWEKFVRYLYDTQKQKVQIFVTGSNSKLLSSEYSSILTGRVIQMQVFPFSFSEVANLLGKNKALGNKTSYLQQYLEFGGLPEIWLQQEQGIKQFYVKNLLDKIIKDDIAMRFNVQDHILLENLIVYLINSVGRQTTVANIVNNLKSFGFSATRQTIRKYIDYFAQAFLITEVKNFVTRSVKQLVFGDLKKYFTVDNSFITATSLNRVSKQSILLENLVFNLLMRFREHGEVGEQYDIYFSYDKSHNLDLDLTLRFYSNTLEGINQYIMPVNVAYALSSAEVIKREVAGLERGIRYFEKVKANTSKQGSANNDGGISFLELFPTNVAKSIVWPQKGSAFNKVKAILFVWEPIYKKIEFPEWLAVINVRDVLSAEAG